MKTMILAIILSLTSLAHADVIAKEFEKNQVNTSHRDGKTTADQFKYVSLYFEASKSNDGFKLIGLVDQLEIVGLDSSKNIHGKYLKQLFIQKVIDNKTLQLGILAPSKTIGGKSNMGGSAVIVGGRAIIKQANGDLSVTIGSVGPAVSGKVPGGRDHATFVEIKVTREYLKQLQLEASVEAHGDIVFVRGVGMLNLNIATGKIVKLVSDVIVEANTGSYMATAGFKFDPFKIFFNRNSRVDVSVNYVHVSSPFKSNRLGLIAPTNMNSMDYITFNLNFALDKKENKVIFIEASYAPESHESFVGFGFRMRF